MRWWVCELNCARVGHGSAHMSSDALWLAVGRPMHLTINQKLGEVVDHGSWVIFCCRPVTCAARTSFVKTPPCNVVSVGIWYSSEASCSSSHSQMHFRIATICEFCDEQTSNSYSIKIFDSFESVVFIHSESASIILSCLSQTTYILYIMMNNLII